MQHFQLEINFKIKQKNKYVYRKKEKRKNREILGKVKKENAPQPT